MMATGIPPSAKKLITSKSEIQISYDACSSLKSKGRQLPKAPSVPDELVSKETVLLRQPLPKYSFQTTKRKVKTDGTKNDGKSLSLNDKSDSVPVGTVKPVSKVEPYLEQSLFVPQPEASKNEVPKLEMVLKSTPDLEWPGSNSEEEVNKLKDEVARLKKELDVQCKVNSELKKLLVASVGDDLESRVERLARDREELSQELGVTTKKRSEDYENLDAISIQADMWRSKYLASRVMSDELASAKSFFAMQYQESQNALHQMLNERHELRTSMMECNRCLQQIKAAFDPLNTQKTTPQNGSSNLDLAKNNYSLVEGIRYRLLPSNIAPQISINMDSGWEDSLTKAESYAYELLSKRVTTDDIKTRLPPAVCNSGSGCSDIVSRYHPKTRYDNLTFNCCPHCKGEITAV